MNKSIRTNEISWKNQKHIHNTEETVQKYQDFIKIKSEKRKGIEKKNDLFPNIETLPFFGMMRVHPRNLTSLS